jgi:hypothetical protein
MSVKIKIPASAILTAKDGMLVLENGNRCSRCDRTPAAYFETHRLKYQVGLRKKSIYSKKFDISRRYQLKIAICEICQQSDFLTQPDLLDRDGSELGRIVQFHALTRMLGGLLAALGFLLLTPFIPEGGILQPLKQIWQIPVAVGVIVLLLTWMSQRKYHQRVLADFEQKHPGFIAPHRGQVCTIVLEDEKDPSLTALELTLENEAWAKEAASINQWDCATTTEPVPDTK